MMRLSHYSTDMSFAIESNALSDIDETKTIQPFEEMKTDIHMTRVRRDKSHPLHQHIIFISDVAMSSVMTEFQQYKNQSYKEASNTT
jgi:hypothetical protein